jgi:hypothetical protein
VLTNFSFPCPVHGCAKLTSLLEIKVDLESCKDCYLLCGPGKYIILISFFSRTRLFDWNMFHIIYTHLFSSYDFCYVAPTPLPPYSNIQTKRKEPRLKAAVIGTVLFYFFFFCLGSFP